MRRLTRCGIAAILCAALLIPATALAGPGDPLRSHQWGLDLIHADPAHAVTTGAGATVAVVDTGIDAAHPDLAGRILPGYDFVDNDATPQDGNGHGTHVSGIIAADADNGIGVDSVAPGAKILPVRVLDSGGSGSDATVAQGIDWAASHGADVINLSLGGTVPTPPGLGLPDPVADAVQRAVNRGIVVVAAAGNDGLPFCENNSFGGKVLCVGAVDKRENRTFYSSFGDGLSLVAPGGSDLPGTDEDVLSTWNDNGYHDLAGTSQATPHVSGVAALLVSLGVRGQAAVQRILATATDLGPAGPDIQFGAGLVNAQAAVAGLRQVAGRGGAGGRGPRVSLARRLRIRTVLRHGYRLKCSAACSGQARYKKVKLASGRGRGPRVTLKVTRHGRKTLKSALRKHHRLRTRVTVRLAGVKLARRVLLVP
jgi:subtilisin family serine protease